MVIRCERCSTLYELDDEMLAPAGSEVQCARCQHVFLARPGVNGAAAPTPPSEQAATSASEKAAAPAAEEAVPAARPAPAPEPAPAPAPPPARTPARVGPAVYRPTPSAVAVSSRPPAIRRGVPGSFEGRLRRNARLRWLAPAAVLVLAGLSGAGWLLLGSRSLADPRAAQARGEGLALLALDDAASLERAVKRLDEAEKTAPGWPVVRADRALADVVRALALVDEARATAAQAADRAAERDRLRAEAPPPPPEKPGAPPAPSPADPGAEAAAEADKLAAVASALEQRAEALLDGAARTLDGLDAAGPARQEIARTRALLAAAKGAAAEQVRAAVAATGADDDAWAALAEVLPAATGGGDHAVQRLASVSKKHPELLRARFLLARALTTAGRRPEALTAVEALLTANPHHERGLALQASLRRPPAAPPQPQAKALAPARNAVAQPAPAGALRVNATASVPSPAAAPAGSAPLAAPGIGAPAQPAPAVATPAPATASGAPPAAASPVNPALSAPLRPVAPPPPEPVSSVKEPDLDLAP